LAGGGTRKAGIEIRWPLRFTEHEPNGAAGSSTRCYRAQQSPWICGDERNDRQAAGGGYEPELVDLFLTNAENYSPGATGPLIAQRS
jgi:hypothetical protein